jgi:hypothetical protein
LIFLATQVYSLVASLQRPEMMDWLPARFDHFPPLPEKHQSISKHRWALLNQHRKEVETRPWTAQRRRARNDAALVLIDQ